MKTFRFFVVLLLTLCVVGCSSLPAVYTQPKGPIAGFTHAMIRKQNGFKEFRKKLLQEHGMKKSDFMRMSTDSAWHLSCAERERLHKFRVSIPKPDSTTLFQKVIPMDRFEHFKANDEWARLGGFVAVAADVKMLQTSKEVYYGLRLDYEGTSFTPTDKEYAVIRFYSNQTEHLRIPFCKEMGGTEDHSWPCSGGGFTTCSLGYGGLPEWVFDVTLTPKEGSEIYVINRKGKEKLALVYKNGRWVEPSQL